MADRQDLRDQPEYWTATSSGGMIATAHYLATAAGADILALGGNAFDAAVSAAIALGVCEPQASGLGGMAIALAYDASRDRTFVLDGACLAPRAATPAKVAQGRRYRGYGTIAVPTQVAVLDQLLRRYGSMPAETLLAPAIRMAEDGYPVSRLQHGIAVRTAKTLRRFNSGQYFLDQDGQAPAVGTLTRQPTLGRTLRRLAADGLDDFYTGRTAREIVEDVQGHGGYLDQDDLAGVRGVPEVAPIEVPFGDSIVRSVPPPGGGIVLLQLLRLVQAMGTTVDPGTAEGSLQIAAMIRQVRRDRVAFRLKIGARGLGAAAELLTIDHAIRSARLVHASLADVAADPWATPAPERPRDAGETTHLSVMDRQGNVVALTQSIERSFGAAVVTPSLGFLYNGYLRAFKVENQAHPHFLRPGVPARLNAAPSIGFRQGRPWVALGSTGSERMASGMFQVLLRLRQGEPFAAVQAPRLHCTPEGLVLLEAERFSPDCLAALARHGFTLEALKPYAFKTGGLQLVLRRGRVFHGVADPRRDGAASGPG